MRRGHMRFIMRHSIAVGAAILTIAMFAVESRGRASFASTARASGVTDATATAGSSRIDLELFHVAALIDMRRALRDARSGAIDLKDVGDDALTFSARLTTTPAGGDKARVETADCSWSDVTRTRAECQFADETDTDGQILSLTVVRNAARQRDVAILISRSTFSAALPPADTRLAVTW